MVFNLILQSLKKLDLYKVVIIIYLCIADGLFNPLNIKKFYSRNVLVRYLYTLMGSFGLLGGELGLGLGLPVAVVVSMIMMFILEFVHNYLATDEEKKEAEYQSFLSNNPQSFIVIAIFFSLLFFWPQLNKMFFQKVRGSIRRRADF